MQKGSRLYQAIIDKSLEMGIDFNAAAEACGLDADLLTSCFESLDGADPCDFYDLLTRPIIDATKVFLGCSGFRIFLLADVFSAGDYHLISASGMFVSPADQEALAAQYLRSVVKSNVFGKPEFMVDEFVAATMSKTLSEACSKANVSYRKLISWKNHISVPELSDLQDIKVMAQKMEMGTPIVMGSLGLLAAEDFTIDGIPVNLEHELKLALDVDIW